MTSSNWGRVVLSNAVLEKRIRELSAQAVAAQGPDELQGVVSELRVALHEHDERLHQLLAEYPFAPTKPTA